MEEHELRSWMCEYPVKKKNSYQIIEKSAVHKPIITLLMFCVYYYLHTHWAVLPWYIFHTLKHKNNWEKIKQCEDTHLFIKQNSYYVGVSGTGKVITLWLPRRSWAKHKLHFWQWKYFSLGPILSTSKHGVNSGQTWKLTELLTIALAHYEQQNVTLGQ